MGAPSALSTKPLQPRCNFRAVVVWIDDDVLDVESVEA